jgi:hypothetical protein
MKLFCRILWACLLSLPLALNAASPVVISEFVASNRNTNLLNQVFGPTAFPAAPDWIEIRNISGAPVNLLNWALTDSPGNLGKWRFPDTNLNTGGYLVIAASGFDRRIAGAPLHANFNLDGGGEFLALVQPDGQIASSFSPVYPPQATDVAYGFGVLSSNALLITSNSSLLRVQIPSSGIDGTNWTYAAFADSDWTLGTNGVGYGIGAITSLFKTDVRTMSNANASAYVRIPFTVNNPAIVSGLVLKMRYDDGFVAWMNGVEILRANAPASVQWNSAATAVHAPTTVEEFRLDDVHMVDARLEKEFTFSDFGFTLGVDVFNVFNEAYVLQRSHRLRVAPNNTALGLNPFTPYGDYVTEVSSPRIFRLGARFSFR